MSENKNQIRIIVLLSGQQLIAKVLDEDKHNVILDKPAIIMTQMDDGKGKFQLGLAPFLPYSKDASFSIKTNIIVNISTPVEALANEYNRMFGSGLDIITKPSLIV